MPPHRDWTRRGVGRALLWWPFTAFVLTAAFPAVAVPAVVCSGVVLVLIGLVGGVVGRGWRARKLRRAGRLLGAIPRAVAQGSDAEGSGAGESDAEGSDAARTGEPGAPNTGEPDTRAA